MKIIPIELKDLEVLYDDEAGEYRSFYKNEKTFPLFLTNYSLSIGKDMGLTKNSLISELYKLKGLESKDKSELNDAYQGLDHTELQKVIYLGFIGANRSIELTFKEFLEKFHYTLEETIEFYMQLVMSLMNEDGNNFANGLKKSTKKDKGKKK